MALFDTLRAAHLAVQNWLMQNPQDPNADPTKKAQRLKMVDAEDELERALETIADEDLQNAVNGLQADAQTLRDAATRIQGIGASFEKVDSVVADVGTIVGILEKLLPAG